MSRFGGWKAGEEQPEWTLYGRNLRHLGVRGHSGESSGMGSWWRGGGGRRLKRKEEAAVSTSSTAYGTDPRVLLRTALRFHMEGKQERRSKPAFIGQCAGTAPGPDPSSELEITPPVLPVGNLSLRV